MRFPLLAVALVAFAAFADASTIEQATGSHYQHDGGHDGDASDACAAPYPDLQPDPAAGIVTPPDDPADFYAFAVDSSAIGTAVKFTLASAPEYRGPPSGRPNYDIRIWGPSCVDVVAASSSPEPVETVSVPLTQPGVYRVEIVLSLGPGAGVVPGPTLASCHPMCTILYPAFGYVVTYGPPT